MIAVFQALTLLVPLLGPAESGPAPDASPPARRVFVGVLPNGGTIQVEDTRLFLCPVLVGTIRQDGEELGILSFDRPSSSDECSDEVIHFQVFRVDGSGSVLVGRGELDAPCGILGVCGAPVTGWVQFMEGDKPRGEPVQLTLHRKFS